MVDAVVNISIPHLLSSPKFQSSNIPGLNNIVRSYVGKVNAKFSDPIFGLSQNFCEICGLYLKTTVEYGEERKTSGFRHSICNEEQKAFYSYTGSLANLQNSPFFRFFLKMKFKHQILEWTSNNCTIMAIKIGSLPSDTMICMGGSSTKYVKLDSQTESMLPLNELDLVNFDWLDIAIDSGWSVMEAEDLDQFLNMVPNRTWFYLKLSQQGKDNYYFVMLYYPFVRKLPQIALIP